MKTILLIAFSVLFFPDPTIYDFKVKSLDEASQINFANYKGKKLLIVNTASKSNLAYQLEDLQHLYSAYRDKLVVVAFPAGSDFGDQEFKTNSQIQDFFTYTYGVTFPVSEKTSVIGTMQHPLYAYLINEAHKQGYQDPVIKWNFTKFLLDEDGTLLKIFGADVSPLSTDVTSYLNNTRVKGPQ